MEEFWAGKNLAIVKGVSVYKSRVVFVLILVNLNKTVLFLWELVNKYSSSSKTTKSSLNWYGHF